MVLPGHPQSMSVLNTCTLSWISKVGEMWLGLPWRVRQGHKWEKNECWAKRQKTIYNLSGSGVHCRLKVALRREWWIKWGPGSSERSMPSTQCVMTWSLEGSLSLHKPHICWTSPGTSCFVLMACSRYFSQQSQGWWVEKSPPSEEHPTQSEHRHLHQWVQWAMPLFTFIICPWCGEWGRDWKCSVFYS